MSLYTVHIRLNDQEERQVLAPSFWRAIVHALFLCRGCQGRLVSLSVYAGWRQTQTSHLPEIPGGAVADMGAEDGVYVPEWVLAPVPEAFFNETGAG